VSITDLIARVRVVATAAVTWITMATVIITAVIPQLDSLGLESWSQWAIRVVGWLAGAVAIIRRVAPVDADERGII